MTAWGKQTGMSLDRAPAIADPAAPPLNPAEPGPALPVTGGPAATDGSGIVPYMVPMFAYVGLGGLESYLPSVHGQPSPLWYPLAYAAKLVIVAMLAWHYRATWIDFRPWPGRSTLVLAVLVGLIVWGLWIGLDGRYPALPFLGTRAGFDLEALNPGRRWAFIVVRLLGLVVLVPLIEELFWRSFLIRWLIDPDFQKVAIGKVTPMAAAVTSGMFALVHPEWLPALLTGALWAWLLWQTRSLAACVVSHAMANLALGAYVIATGDWKYW
jgi:CAAX prenyl protease-like protein